MIRGGVCRFGKASDQGLSLKRAGPLPAIKVGDPQHVMSCVRSRVGGSQAVASLPGNALQYIVSL